ncbi:MAG: CDP-diacylglycerol--serine O-phosphatidyltransferase [Calditrichota bacterium]
MQYKALLPNGVTLSNLFLGYWAIILATQGRYTTACWLIVIATILDGLDGTLARLTRQSSKFGAEIDSFADAISFGLAPSILVHNAVLYRYGFWGLALAFLPVIAGVVRLVRFKALAATKPKFRGFIGTPIPTNALLLVGYYLYSSTLNDGVVEGKLYLSLIPAISLLMVSPIPYRRLPVVQIHGSRHPWIGVVILILTTACVIWNPALTIFPLMLVYMIIGPVEWLIVHLHNNEEEEAEDAPFAGSISPRDRHSSSQTRRRSR